MMNLLILFISTLAGGWIFPWWWPALVGYGIGFSLAKSPGRAFLEAFIATALAWGAMAAYMDWKNNHLLAGKIALIFHLPNYASVIAITALVGGLCGGTGSWAGFAMGAYLRPKFRSSL